MFSSPFIEERLYLLIKSEYINRDIQGSRPLLSRSGCIYCDDTLTCETCGLFSSPFIEERLYLKTKVNAYVTLQTVLVPFYRGAVVFSGVKRKSGRYPWVLVPFYRGAVVFLTRLYNCSALNAVLVPFYRGAVVFKALKNFLKKVISSRPLLSRSGCI